jgi:hypothetical protein
LLSVQVEIRVSSPPAASEKGGFLNASGRATNRLAG